MSTASPSSRVPLFLGCGCLALVGLTCLGSVAAFGAWRWILGASATTHAVTFFQALERRDYATAYDTGISRYDHDLYSLADFTACLQATPLGVMTDVTCNGDHVDLEMNGRSADVPCTITTPSGPVDVVLGVNDPSEHPYNGFVWFPPGAAVGAEWHSDRCATWSGREYFREPPPGMARP